MKFYESRKAKYAFSCGSVWGLLLMTRPTEAVWISIPSIFFCIYTVVVFKQPIKQKIIISNYGIFPAILFIIICIYLHYICYGWSLGPYLSYSLDVGFDRRLLVTNWIEMVLGSQPTHEKYYGLAYNFWWVLPGFAGILTALICDKTRWHIHILVGGTVIFHWLVYLCYRDLHPEGLWRYWNYHYFKWTQPFLFIYGIFFMRYLFNKSYIYRAICCFSIVMLMSCWNFSLKYIIDSNNKITVLSKNEIYMTNGMQSPLDILLIPARGNFNDIYRNNYDFYQHGRWWISTVEFKAWPLYGNIALSPLKEFPAGAALLKLSSEITVPIGSRLYISRRVFHFGIPCMVYPSQTVCMQINKGE
ncbi:hypothetical protein HUK81_12075 [Komagataeibacter swingsii]|uniref:Uncharacterized protein n=2 Tax=Komagataeibacter swingsii TaxID=215220 RepID=A0A850NZ26_9PROT|nr:hypothetical protein [Komagataeibacter swingsii]